MKYANLHLHSVYSDGVLTPDELCRRAKEMGYGALSLTDHYTALGWEAMERAAALHGLEYLPGIECCGAYGGKNHHIVGYGLDITEPAFARYLQENEESAYCSTKAKFDAMTAAGRLEGLTWQEVLDDAPARCWFCNEQIFASLVKRRGWKQEEYYPRFIPLFRGAETGVRNTATVRTAEEMISLIRNAGGVASLAHPHGSTRFLPELFAMGLNCVEYDHPDIDGYDSAEARKFAKEHRIYLAGGTDHTGPQLADFPLQRTSVAEAPACGKGILTPMSVDVRCGATKEEFDALKNRIYG